MTYLTHMAVGANTVWLSLLVTSPDERVIILGVLGALASLLPDIDAVAAKIHFVGGGVLGIFRGGFKHRGFFHSLLAGGIVFVVSYIFLSAYDSLLAWAIVLGYLSHPIIDGFNYGGVQYLFPHKKKFNLLPKFLRTPVKGIGDYILLTVAIGFLMLWYLKFFLVV
jgi:membrane-bound metal-dependent hydrolase YbcI (DUF457 family)